MSDVVAGWCGRWLRSAALVGAARPGPNSFSDAQPSAAAPAKRAAPRWMGAGRGPAYDVEARPQRGRGRDLDRGGQAAYGHRRGALQADGGVSDLRDGDALLERPADPHARDLRRRLVAVDGAEGAWRRQRHAHRPARHRRREGRPAGHPELPRGRQRHQPRRPTRRGRHSTCARTLLARPSSTRARRSPRLRPSRLHLPRLRPVAVAI